MTAPLTKAERVKNWLDLADRDLVIPPYEDIRGLLDDLDAAEKAGATLKEALRNGLAESVSRGRIAELERDLAAAREQVETLQQERDEVRIRFAAVQTHVDLLSSLDALLLAEHEARERIAAICEALSHKQDHPNPIECAAQAVNEAKRLRERIAALERIKRHLSERLDAVAAEGLRNYEEIREERDTLKRRFDHVVAIERQTAQILCDYHEALTGQKRDPDKTHSVDHALIYGRAAEQRIEELERARRQTGHGIHCTAVEDYHADVCDRPEIPCDCGYRALSSPEPPDAGVKKVSAPLTKAEREELRRVHRRKQVMDGHRVIELSLCAKCDYACPVIRLLDDLDAAERRALGWRNAAIIHTNFRRDTGRLVKMRIQGLERDLAAAHTLQAATNIVLEETQRDLAAAQETIRTMAGEQLVTANALAAAWERLAAMERKLDMEQIGHAQSVQRIEELERVLQTLAERHGHAMIDFATERASLRHWIRVAREHPLPLLEPPDAEVKG